MWYIIITSKGSFFYAIFKSYLPPTFNIKLYMFFTLKAGVKPNLFGVDMNLFQIAPYEGGQNFPIFERCRYESKSNISMCRL